MFPNDKISLLQGENDIAVDNTRFLGKGDLITSLEEFSPRV